MTSSTYRLQLNYQFTFSDVIKQLGYFQRLGIKTLYFSPITSARKNSIHGYDVVNYNQIFADLGGLEKFKELLNELTKYNLNLLLDFVPNHMSASAENIWWQDICEKGKESTYAHFFDINWEFSTKSKMAYRRFFDINELICMNATEPNVFAKTHLMINELLKEKSILGLRVDHIDGIRDPKKYLDQLTQLEHRPPYIIVEKILANDEKIPQEWHINGTTGYDFLNECNTLFILKSGIQNIINQYNKIVESNDDVETVRVKNNIKVINELFKNEFNILVLTLRKLSSHCYYDFSYDDIASILMYFSAYLPVYRTYVNNNEITIQDQEVIKHCLSKIKLLNHFPKDNLEFLEKFFTLDFPDNIKPAIQEDWLSFMEAWQVFTAPMVAKGFEDTTCYTYNPFISLNEVGSSPGFFEETGEVDRFHRYNRYKYKRYALSLNTTSTHDTKRSEDVRARLNVLSELSFEWNQALDQWLRYNKPKKTIMNQVEVPSINEEIFFYQSMIGAWPDDDNKVSQFHSRFKEFITKALREAKVNTSWQHQNELYEKSVHNYFHQVFNDKRFLNIFLPFKEKVSYFGKLNSLSQVVLKCVSPGIPDFYQGNETWQFDLVDPDNRHSVNFVELKRLLDEVLNQPVASLDITLSNSQLKLSYIHNLLKLRNAHLDLFEKGDYIPLNLHQNIISFMRVHEEKVLLALVPRYFTLITKANVFPINELWKDSILSLPEGLGTTWHSTLDQQILIPENNQLDLTQTFKHLPHAVLCNFSL